MIQLKIRRKTDFLLENVVAHFFLLFFIPRSLPVLYKIFCNLADLN